MKTIDFLDKKICYKDEGEGDTLVLLHGFTESMDIWDNFRLKLSDHFRVITPDLPGHGCSDNVAEVHTMEIMAEVVKSILDHCGILSCIMIGHSMGGYVTLAFGKRYPEMLKKFGLFHSHPFADTVEQKLLRDRTSRIAEADKFGFVAGFIPELFPEESRGKFSSEIESLVKKASAMKKEGVIASLQGMKLRSDQSDLLKNTDLPFLLIVGSKDSKFPQERLNELLALSQQTHCLLLRETGHMGYIEEEEVTFKFLKDFSS